MHKCTVFMLVVNTVGYSTDSWGGGTLGVGEVGNIVVVCRKSGRTCAAVINELNGDDPEILRQIRVYSASLSAQ